MIFTDGSGGIARYLDPNNEASPTTEGGIGRYLAPEDKKKETDNE
jgi:hypothetical protein